MSCLFDSLSSFIQYTDGSRLRQQIVDFLKTDPIMMDDVRFSCLMEWDNGDAEHYLQKMIHHDQWGGAIEIRAFCKLYKCRVVVHIAENKRIVEFETDEIMNPPSYHILWTGNHFIPLN